MTSIIQRIQVQIANTQIDAEFYALAAISESTIRFEYLGDQHYPPLSLLNLTIDLASDFDSDPYQQFMTAEKSQAIQLKEIYPFTRVEIQTIIISSSITSIGGGFMTTGQAVSSIAAGGVSLSLVRMQMIAEIVQLLRFVDIRWPANVNQLFSVSHVDPSSMVLPIDFMTSWNDNLENFNTSMPRVFREYELSPFFTENYKNELSNLLLLVAIVVGGSILINYFKQKLRKITANLKMPKTNARRTAKIYCTLFLLRLSRLLNRSDISLLWNIGFMFLLSIYQSGVLWSLVNIRYYSAILDPVTYFTKGTMAIAIIFLCFYSFLTLFVFKAVISNLKHVVGIKEQLWPLHIKKYISLFDDFECRRKIQVLFIPLSLTRGLVFSSVVALFSTSPEVQMILFWCTQTAFVAYMIIFAPLKDKWGRRITLLMELMAIGCMTFGFIMMIIGKFGNVDAVTLNETGFAFISFCVLSTLSGGVLCLLQVIGLLINVIKYIKNAKRKRNEVYPMNLTEMYSKTNEEDSPKTDSKLRAKEKIESPSKPLNQGEKTLQTPSMQHLTIQNNFLKVSRAITLLTPEKLNETPQGAHLLKSMEEWWNLYSEADSMTALNETLQKPGKKRDTQARNRLTLFVGD